MLGRLESISNLKNGRRNMLITEARLLLIDVNRL